MQLEEVHQVFMRWMGADAMDLAERRYALLRQVALQHLHDHDLCRKLSGYDDEDLPEEDAIASVLNVVREGGLVLVADWHRDPPFIIRHRAAATPN